MEEPVIEARSLGKYYRVYSGNAEKWMDLLLPGNHGTNFWALRKASFQVRAGEAVGLVGLNGSGKSTLCDLIAGVSRPGTGSLRVKGKTSMIAVSAGLNLNLTGIENIEMKGLLIGMKLRQIRQLMPQIIAFSSLEHFIRQPVRTYSSGMRARLAFAIAINVDPDILVIDEGLSVGDNTFVDRCLNRIAEFQQEGKAMVMTSHSTDQLKKFCKRLIWLENGEIRMDAGTDEVSRSYSEFLQWHRQLSEQEKTAYARNAYEIRCRRARGERLQRSVGDAGGKRLRF